MKKILLSIFTIASMGVFAQNVNIPDANFKAYLVGNSAINTNGDTEIQVSEANAFTGHMNCAGLSISSLTGIEAFTSLTSLDCNFTQVTSINLSSNAALTSLSCYFISQLTSVDVSSNSMLTVLDCQGSSLSTLNVANGNNSNFISFNASNTANLSCIQVDDVAYSNTNWTNIDPGASFSTSCGPCTVNIPDANFKAYLVGNTAINTNGDTEIQCSEASSFTGQLFCDFLSISDLTGIEAFVNITDLVCSSNQLTSLDVSQNTALEYLDCQFNQIASLDVSQLPALDYLRCRSNNLSMLDVSSNPLLEILICQENQISSLNLSSNPALVTIASSDNQLTNFNVSNGNNTSITGFWTTNNPNLTCIQVDDVAYSNTNWTNIDPGASFSTSCGPCTVNIPDANFKAYLVGNTEINTNADTEIQCSEASAFTGHMSCQNLNIADLTGIESFTELNYLHVSQNNLTSLDLSQNLQLDTLNCTLNQLTNLDLTANTNLKLLACHFNQLSGLNMSQNTDLITLNCSQNQISSLDFSINSSLVSLDCSNNLLTTLNVSNGNNTNFTTFNATNNANLTCIEVDDATYSTTNWTNIDTTASFSEDCSAGVGIEEELLSKFSISPNPTNATLNIQSDIEINNLTIRNTLGQIVLTTSDKSIDVSSFENGVYLVTIFTDNGVVTKRFIKE